MGKSTEEWLREELDHDTPEDTTRLIAFKADVDSDVIYCAVGRTYKELGLRDVSATVFVGAKLISEEEGPVADDCPAEILSLLTPTRDEAARDWRQTCRHNLLMRSIPPAFDGTDAFTVASLKAILGTAKGIMHANIIHVQGDREDYRISGGSEAPGRLRLHLTNPILSSGDKEFDHATFHTGIADEFLRMLTESEGYHSRDGQKEWNSTRVVLTDFRKNGVIIEYPIQSFSRDDDGHLTLFAIGRASIDKYWENELSACVEQLKETASKSVDEVTLMFNQGGLKNALRQNLNNLLLAQENIVASSSNILTLLGCAESGISVPLSKQNRKRQ